jgi:hypothetical protein
MARQTGVAAQTRVAAQIVGVDISTLFLVAAALQAVLPTRRRTLALAHDNQEHVCSFMCP